jgi:hypothetical protein
LRDILPDGLLNSIRTSVGTALRTLASVATPVAIAPVTIPAITSISVAPVPALASGLTSIPILARLAHWPLIARDLVEILVLFKEVGNVKEGIPLQAQIDECRLHPGKNSCNAAFVNAPCQGVLIGALKKRFYQQIIFKDCHLGLVPVGRDHHFLTHQSSLSRDKPFKRPFAASGPGSRLGQAIGSGSVYQCGSDQRNGASL